MPEGTTGGFDDGLHEPVPFSSPRLLRLYSCAMDALKGFTRPIGRLPAAALALALAGACAGTDGERTGREYLSNDCIFYRGVRDYKALDERNLIVYGVGRRPYHVVLASPSTNLEHEFTIAIYDDGDGRICPYGRDAVLIDGPIPDRIQIRSIEAIDDNQVEALEVEYGLIEPAEDAVSISEIQ